MRVDTAVCPQSTFSSGADCNALDGDGNSPGHLAAVHGDLELLEELLYADNPLDMDQPNSSGLTPRRIAIAALEPAASRPSSGAAAAVAAAREDDFRSRLRDAVEADDGELGGGWWGSDWDAPSAGGDGIMDEEAYRAHVVGEMGARKFARSQPAPAEDVPRGRPRGKVPEAEAKHWRKVLEEEVEKDRRWRERVVQGNDSRRLREEYERRWQEFLLREKAPGSLSFGDVPWMAPPGSGRETVGRVALAGVDDGDGSARQKRLRVELMRWHPDKFMARFSRFVRTEESERVLRGVTETSAVLTSLGSS
uniref:NF-kappa-B inhibitor-like protein 1 n=1 Tax=Tetraselmis sp. GSL018 TaxID=582737 RepID=A0A061RBU3_9CHLO